VLHKEYDGFRHFAFRDLLFIIFNHVLGIALGLATDDNPEVKRKPNPQKEKIETIKMY
jgi:hypothetical protein